MTMPQRVLGSTRRHALHGVARTREIEQQAQAGLAPNELMQRAGRATARLALALAPHARRVWIAAGPGNNGGDGLEAASLLAMAGMAVEVSLLADAARLPADAALALARAQAVGVVVTPTLAGFEACGPDDLAIDALLGIGARRAPEGELAAAVERLNRFPGTLLAVDVPSGLDADTGQPWGEGCVRAGHTLGLLTLKPGLFTGVGRDRVGTVWFDSLQVDTASELADAWLAGRSEPQARSHAEHKGSFGDLGIVGGASGMVGAAVLAARAGQAAGAGRVFVQCLTDNPPGFDALHPELMFRPSLLSDRKAAQALACIVCGCGGGTAVREVLVQVLALPARLVLDADALNAIAADSALQAQLAVRAGRGLASVLTPHPLEAARLLGIPTAEVQADRLAAADRLARQFRCCVLLKGSGSIVAAPGRTPSINPTGNASLASAGTGDVLAGWLGGLWAGRPADDGFEVAVQAAYEHGAAAPPIATAALRASELIERLAGFSRGNDRQPR